MEFGAALNWLSQVSYEAADGATYRNPSIHYIVGHDGRLATVVPERHGAWHAGTGADREGANLNAIGIELVQPTADTPYPEALIARAVSLVAEICHRHDIPARRTRDDAQPGIHHHSDLTAGKSDPGPCGPARRSSGGSARGCGRCAARTRRPARRPPSGRRSRGTRSRSPSCGPRSRRWGSGCGRRGRRCRADGGGGAGDSVRRAVYRGCRESADPHDSPGPKIEVHAVADKDKQDDDRWVKMEVLVDREALGRLRGNDASPQRVPDSAIRPDPKNPRVSLPRSRRV